MAQENFFDDDSTFGVDSGISVKELEADLYGEAVTASAKSTSVKPATEEDKKEAAEKGKATTDEAKLAKIKEEQLKAEKEAREDFESDEGQPKSKKSVVTTNADDTEEEEGTETELSGLQELSEDLFKVGIFTRDDDDDNSLPETTEEFIERFNWEKQKGAEQMVYNLFNRHGSEWEQALTAIALNGVHPVEYLKSFNEVQSFKTMDLTDEDNQQRVVEAALRNQGWDETDIKDEVKKLKMNADLESSATRHHKALVKSEEQRLQKMELEAKQNTEARKQREAQYSHNIRTILNEKVKSGEYDGIPVTRQDVDKVSDFLDTKRWKLADGSLITNFDKFILDLNHPQNHAAKVKLALLIGKNYDPEKPITIDVGPVGKTAVSKENRELFNFEKRKKNAPSTVSDTNKKPAMSFIDGL